LFELLRDKTGTTAASQQQASAIPVTPQTRPKPEIKVDDPLPPVRPPPPPTLPDPERPKAWVTERGGGGLDLARPLRLNSSSRMWIGISLGVVGAVAIWSVAYSLGYKRADDKAARDFATSGGGGAGKVDDPLKSNPPAIPVNPNLITTESRKPAATSPASEVKKPIPPPSQVAVDGDPRQPGLDYYTIATKIDLDTARMMVKFLSDNGVPALAIPVAKAATGAKNGGSYTVYAAEGITREQFKARTPERTQLEDAVQRLGKRWQKEHKGQADFSTAWWDKFGS
jgi:hypothetical protein